jgi:hypothetical protein
MTLPHERTRAVINTATFLTNLMNPKETPGVPKHVRQYAAHMLKHYPTTHDMYVTSEAWCNDKVTCPFAYVDSFTNKEQW